MCARKMGEGRACPSPEAALAAAEPSAVRVYGPGLASAAARRPAGPPPPRRARPGAPPLVLAAYGRRTRGGGHGLAGRAVGASQTTVMSWWPNNLQSCQNKGDLAMEALLEGIQNRGHDGGFLTSCEAELQELMKQIDIMVAHKKSEWEGQTHALETCLDIREQELKSLRSQLDMKHKEVGMLRQQVEEHEKVKHEMAMDYKQELKKLQEEAQLVNRKQKLESVELSRQSEIQHLSSKLERANDTICANELEIERLTMRVNDLVGTNKTVIQEQRQKEEKLRESEKMLEVLQEEKRQLKATLHSQENFIHDTKMQKETLQAKLRATDIQHTVEVIRSLEESQTERQYTTHEQDLDNVLSQLDLTHTSEELLQAEVTRLESSLESVSITCKQLSQELMEKYEELKKMEVHNNEYRAEIKKLKEQILQADQSYSSALEGMKLEISQLTRELHQRDVTIASAKSSSSDMEKRLKAEIQKAEEKAVEHKEILDQLESLKLENRHLSEMVKKLEVGLHEAKGISLADLQENYIEALNKLVSENQQLQKDLMATQSKLDISTQMCQKNHDTLLKPTHSRSPGFKNTEFKPSHGQCRHDGTNTEHYKAGLHSARGQAPDRAEPVARALSSLSSPLSPYSSCSSEPSNFLYKAHSLPSVLDPNEVLFSDTISESVNDRDASMCSCTTAVSPLGSIATRFLEEEELRSHHILERLDAHIEELKRESEKTVRQFTTLK
ncbi:centrosomal protein of 63 kDa isoform X5 [Pipistrellus kuhlii]|uniref:centrosomal protein of 63 kDa isoform X5 n=1 Tax=Pipistrellus kuhlii TaxID=59472 RepID=UPI001E26ECD4|nr:centrosomal protein of 63 kDa isoform X5 [Pipistrellus kuhlii]